MFGRRREHDAAALEHDLERGLVAAVASSLEHGEVIGRALDAIERGIGRRIDVGCVGLDRHDAVALKAVRHETAADEDGARATER